MDTAPLPPSAAAEFVHPVAAPPLPRHWRVLDVDGDLPSRRTVVEALTHAGFTVECLTDPHAALALAGWEPLPAGVAILASRLPGATGLELARVMRLTGFDGQIVVVAANLPASEQTACATLRVTAVLTKPFRLHALLAALDSPPSPAPLDATPGDYRSHGANYRC